LDDGPLQITKGSIQVDVEYDNAVCGTGGDTVPTARAQDCLDAVDTSYDLFVGFGFRTPYLNTLPDYEILIYDIPQGSGEAFAGCIRLNSPSFDCDANDFDIREVTLHEMFHTIQRHYMCAVRDCDSGTLGGTFGQWISEGTARCIEDHLYLDHDLGGAFHFAGNGIQETFANPGRSLYDLSYEGCLFWSYCLEQMGTVNVEPEYGVDFMVDFWEQIEDNGSNNGARALREVIEDAGRGSLQALYLDYAICNYTHPFDVSTLPHSARYDYVDETQMEASGVPAPAYPLVDQAAVGLPSNSNGTVDRYATRYYVASVAPGLTCQAVGFRGECSDIFGSINDERPTLGWAVVGATADGRATVLSKGRGREWGRTVIVSPSDPITSLAGIVVGQSRGGDFDYWFGSGPMSLSIFRPTHDEPARPGPASEEGRFLARIFVDGPNNLKPEGAGVRSVAGLRAEDFTVHVGAEETDVLTAAYVGGEYWLAIRAPIQPGGDGFYDLRISLCDQLVATSVESVLYGNYRINHMVVIDQSGSMARPSVHPKIDAAMNAATLYVDAVRVSDRIGVVTFNGNRVHCDDDAHLIEALEPATDTKREDARDSIALIEPDSRTSIGDGLWKAQDQLDLFVSPIDMHRMILLSDGKENEERHWEGVNLWVSDAKTRIVPTDTIVDAVAFGPHSDQDLMQEIADETLGDYSYVDVRNSAGEQSIGAPTSTVNDLADAYMWSLQRSRDLQRLFHYQTALSSGVPRQVRIEVRETAVFMGTFFFNVDAAGSNLSVKLYRPDGVQVDDTMAKIHTTDTHLVFHMYSTLMGGMWQAVVRSDTTADLIVGLLGHPYQGANVRLAASQVWTGGVYQQHVGGKFEHGVPVTLLAFVSDLAGPVRAADVYLTVTKPDGTISCGPREMRDDGTQNDGEADDGVYGLVYTDTAQASAGGIDNDDPGSPPASEERGSYKVQAEIKGVSNSNEVFLRVAVTWFHVYRDPVRHDGDVMPDTWEVYYGTNPYVVDDEDDPDDDGLKNYKEFEHGTDPADPDTDDDGEADGSEVDAGRCPLDPRDGWLPAPADVEVVIDTADEDRTYLRADTNLLRFPWESSYQFMRIYRAIGMPTGFALHWVLDAAEGSDGNYFDDAEFGTMYHYRFQAQGASNTLTRKSKVVSGTPVLMGGDTDGDGDRDLGDFRVIPDCFEGPGIRPDPWPLHGEDCLRIFDRDLDGDVDLLDFARFQDTFTDDMRP